jgi:uncharacterized phage-like protein YoqJ
MKNRVVSFTGHRPDKLPGGWQGHKERGIMARLIAKRLKAEDVKYVIVGGALGIDQIAMKAAVYAKCRILLVEPFPGFYKKWPAPSIEEYMELKYRTSPQQLKIIYANENEKYEGWKMQHRNKVMVDKATEVWAYWNGDDSGGTANCVRYAESEDKEVTNLYEELNEQLAREMATS